MNENPRSVNEMIQAAHEQAKRSGFWDDLDELKRIATRAGTAVYMGHALDGMAVAQKLALIGTELFEFDREADGDPRDALEELADVVIRTFDLCGYLEATLSEMVLEPPEPWNGPDCYELFESGSKAVFAAVQNHRKGGDAEAVDNLEGMLIDLSAATRARYGPDALREAIELKMKKNESRPHKHNASY